MESNCPVKGPFDVFQPHHGILLLLLSYFCNNDTRGYTFPPVRGLKGPEGWQAPLPTHRFRGLVILYQKLKNGWNSQKSVFFITRGSFQPTGSWAASCFLFTSGVPGPLRFSLPYNYTHSCTGFSAKSCLNHKSCGIYSFAHTPDVKYQTLSEKNNRHRDTHNPSFGLF